MADMQWRKSSVASHIQRNLFEMRPTNFDFTVEVLQI